MHIYYTHHSSCQSVSDKNTTTIKHSAKDNDLFTPMAENTLKTGAIFCSNEIIPFTYFIPFGLNRVTSSMKNKSLKPKDMSVQVMCLIYGAPNLKTYMLLISSCSCLYPIRWSQVLSWEWRCSWSSADRRCSNYIWVINNLIVYLSATYIRDLTVGWLLQWQLTHWGLRTPSWSCVFREWPGALLLTCINLYPSMDK